MLGAMRHPRHRTLLTLALLSVGGLTRCECEPEPIAEIRCEFTVDPHDQGAGSNPIDYGNVALGEQRTRTVAVRNTGTVHLENLRFDFGGQNGEHFALGVTLPALSVGGQSSVPIVFEPRVAAAELNHTLVVDHPAVQGVACSAFTVSLRGGAFERPDVDAGVDDAGGDAGEDAGDDAGADAGVDAGPLEPLPDAGVPFDGSGGFVAVAALQDPRSHFAAVAVEDGGVLVGGGFGPNGEVLDSIERVDAETGHSRVVARFAEGTGRARLVATRMPDGRVVFSGGLLPGSTESALPSDEVAVFQPLSDNLTALAHSLTPARVDHCAVAVGDQDLLVAFGETRANPGDPWVPVGAPQLIHLDSAVPETVVAADSGADDPRAGVSATALDDGRVVFIGGRGTAGQLHDSVVIYTGGQLHPTAATLATPRWQHSAALLGDGRIVVIGGLGGGDVPVALVELLDPSGDPASWSFTALPDAPLLGARVRPLLARLSPEVLLVAGGGPRGDTSAAGPAQALQDAALLIRLEGGALLVGAPGNHLALPRWRAEMVELGSRALVLGGSTTTGRRSAQASVERFDLSQGRFEAFGLLGPGAVATPLADGALLVSGGVDPHSGTVSARTRIYRPDTGLLFDGPALAVARRDHSAVQIAFNLLLITGGRGRAGAALDAVELFDLSSGESLAGPSLLLPRLAHSGSLLVDGSVLLCGGRGAGEDLLDSCEIYTTAGTPLAVDDDQVMLVSGFLSSARAGHLATPLDDDHLLLSGGVDPARGRRADDLYQVSTGTLRPVGELPATPRRHHVAVQVGLGRVLLAGGETYNGAYVATDSAALYDLALDGYLELPAMVTTRVGPSALRFADGLVMLSGGVRGSSGVPGRPSQALLSSELFDPNIAPHGGFVAVDVPLRAPRGMALGVQVMDQPLVLFGESRDGLVDGAVEQRSFQISIERYDPEAP